MVDKPARSPSKEGVLGRVAGLGLIKPRATIIVSLLLLAACALFAFDMPISTSRYKLVSTDNPFQARMQRFFDRFGYPDSLVMVIGGQDGDARRKAVDELSRKLEQEPALEGRVLGRIEANDVAELLFLFKPDALKQLRSRLKDEPADLFEGGLPRWIDALNDQLEAGLDEDEDEDEDEDAPDEAEQDRGLLRLAAMIRALEAQLAGGDPAAHLHTLGDSFELPKSATIDEFGYLTTDDGKHHLIALFPELPGMEGHEVQPLVDKIRSIRDGTDLGGVEAKLSGLPALVADELSTLSRSLMHTSVGTGVGILLLLLLCFRSKRYMVLSMIPLCVGLVLTLAATRGLFGGLNLITSSFVPVLLALGIDFGVYALSRYGELGRDGADTESAIRGALVKAGPGMLIGAATTMMAFLTATVIEFTAYSELGIITAIGMALMIAVTFLLLPALILAAGRGEKIHTPELMGVHHLPTFVRRRHKLLPAAAVMLVALGALSWNQISFNANYFEFLPEDGETAWGLKRIEADALLSPIQASSGVDSIEQARVLVDKLRALDSVSSVQTATDLLPELDPAALKQLRQGFSNLERQPDFDKLRNRKRSAKELAAKLDLLGDTLDEVGFAMRRAKRSTSALDEVQAAVSAAKKRLSNMPDDAPQIAEAETRLANILDRAWNTAKRVSERGRYLPQDLPVIFQALFVAKDGIGLAVFSNPAGDIWNADQAKKFALEVQQVDPEISGLAVSVHEHMRMIRDGFANATMLSASMVLVILLLGFRRLDEALFAILPVVLGVAGTLGVMGLIGLDFDVANIVAVPLLTGIGVDAGAHMMHRWRQSAESHGGVANLDEMIRGTGAAMLMASLTTATGFAALLLGEYGGMRTLGLTMTIGIGACLLTSLLVLPAVLVLLKKAR